MSPAQKSARRRILEAAVASFQTFGYARSTTQMIAANAGVAEVTLFRHFGDKQTLFRAAVQQIGGGPGMEQLQAQLTDDPAADLPRITRHILSFFFAQRDAIRMLMFESSHFPEMKAALAQNPVEVITFLDRYLRRQMENGRLPSRNPDALSQAFLSMLFGYAIAVEPMQDQLPAAVEREEMIAEFVLIFLTRITASG